jgi:hypothetical protein
MSGSGQTLKPSVEEVSTRERGKTVWEAEGRMGDVLWEMGKEGGEGVFGEGKSWDRGLFSFVSRRDLEVG